MKKILIVAALSLFSLAVSLPAFPEEQPHMQTALEALRQAEKHLNEASHDKGGHRAKALVHVKAAIAEIERGIQFDNAHPDKDARRKK